MNKEQLLSLDDIKRIEIGLLDYVVNVCEQYTLRYFLIFGTLIGAVRHKGFIPWDDDIDIVMPRKDYEQLNKILSQTKSERYVLLNDKTKGYTFPFAKVVDTKTQILEETLEDFEYNGIWIDIFPLDGIKNIFHYKACYLINKCRAASIYKQFPKGRGGSYWGWKLCRIIGHRFFAKLFNKICTKYDYEASDEVGVMGTYKTHFPREIMDEITLLEFEGKKYCAPKNYDYILSFTYGDYMKLPPENERITHHIKAIMKE